MGKFNAALLVAVVLGVAAILGWKFAGTNGQVNQTANQAAGAGRPLVAVTVPEKFTMQARLGEDAFNGTCAACHGSNAAGTEVGPPLVHKVYEPSHHSDYAFYIAATNGVRAHHWKFGDMPPQPDVSEKDLVNIVAYVRELQRANGIY